MPNGLSAPRVGAGVLSSSSRASGIARLCRRSIGPPRRALVLPAASEQEGPDTSSDADSGPPPGYVFRQPPRPAAPPQGGQSIADGDFRFSQPQSAPRGTRVTPAEARRLAAAAALNSVPTTSYATTPSNISEIIGETLGSGSDVWRSGAARQLTSLVPPHFVSDTATYSNEDLAEKVVELASLGLFDQALQLIEDIALGRPGHDALASIGHRTFMQHAALHRASKAALGFLHALPKRYHGPQLYTLALAVCASARDIESGVACVELADRFMFRRDTTMMTALMKVCASLGLADRAFRVLADMKARKLVLDGHVYGVLVHACSEAIQRDFSVVHERKEQFVLLERAMNLIAEAETGRIKLEAPVWNSLMTCAGRCGELTRAFEVIAMMQLRNIAPTAYTFGALIEACVHSKEKAMALRIYRNALAQGFTQEVVIYTQAMSACKVEGAVDLQEAFDIYVQMQRNNVEPDKKLYACLCAVAGKAGRLHVAFELLTNMVQQGIPLHSTLCSALIHACLLDKKLPAARKVYDYCRQHGVFPTLSQFNRLMDWYATEGRFGDVVSLLTDLVQHGLQPNLNTYRVLLNACQRSGQALLALQVYALMKANRMNILQESFVHSIYFIVLKCCLNQQRQSWRLGGYPPTQTPSTAVPVARAAEGQRMLQALGADRFDALLRPFTVTPVEGVNWTGHAVAVYRDMITCGHKPSLDILDLLLGCLRTKLKPSADTATAAASVAGPSSAWPRAGSSRGAEAGRAAAAAAAAAASAAAAAAQALADSQQSTYEVPFDRRALQVVEEAIRLGVLPAVKPEDQAAIDLRGLPPTLAEVYVLHMLNILERRAERDMPRSMYANYFSPIMLVVPPFDPNYVNWPSYVDKLHFNYPKLEDTLADSLRRARSVSPTSTSTSRTLAWQAGRRTDDAGSPSSNGRAFTSLQASSNGASSEGSTSDNRGSDGEQGDLFLQPEEEEDLLSAEEEEQLQQEEADERDHARLMAELRQEAEAAASSTSSASSSSAAGYGRVSSKPPGSHGGSHGGATGLAVAATLKRMKLWVNMDAERGRLVLDAREQAGWVGEKSAYEKQARADEIARVATANYNARMLTTRGRGTGVTNPATFGGSAGQGGFPAVAALSPSMSTYTGPPTADGALGAHMPGQTGVSAAILRQRQVIRMSLMTEATSARVPGAWIRSAPPTLSLGGASTSGLGTVGGSSSDPAASRPSSGARGEGQASAVPAAASTQGRRLFGDAAGGGAGAAASQAETAAAAAAYVTVGGKEAGVAISAARAVLKRSSKAGGKQRRKLAQGSVGTAAAANGAAAVETASAATGEDASGGAADKAATGGDAAPPAVDKGSSSSSGRGFGGGLLRPQLRPRRPASPLYALADDSGVRVGHL